MRSKISKTRRTGHGGLVKEFNSFGKIPGIVEIDSSKAKSRFSKVVQHVKGGGIVAVKLHNEPVGMFVPMAEYDRLRQATTRKLDLLTGQFDELVRSMQQPDFAPRAHKAFADMAERAPLPAVIAGAAAARRG